MMGETLHPKIHGDTGDESRLSGELGTNNQPIDIVAVNLYPFGRKQCRGDSEEAIENVDVSSKR